MARRGACIAPEWGAQPVASSALAPSAGKLLADWQHSNQRRVASNAAAELQSTPKLAATETLTRVRAADPPVSAHEDQPGSSDSRALPFAPLQQTWRDRGVLDLVVQSAISPADPNLASSSACSLQHQSPWHQVGGAIKLQPTEVAALTLECSLAEGDTAGDVSQGGPRWMSTAWNSAVAIPEPHLTVGFKGQWMETSASAAALWDKVGLEPYGGPKTLLYYVLCPEHLVSLAHMFMGELASEYRSCQLGQLLHGPSSPTLRAIDGILPIPLTAPASEADTLQGQTSAQPLAPRLAFHPLLGAPSNHAAGFHPGLDQGLGRSSGSAAAAGACSLTAAVPGLDGGLAGDSSSGGSTAVAGGRGVDLAYIRNLRHTLDMLQRHLMVSPPQELRDAVAPPTASGRVAAKDGISSHSGDTTQFPHWGDSVPVSVAVFIIAPSDQPVAAVRALAEAACRLAPAAASPSLGSPGLVEGGPDDLAASSLGQASELLGPATPPLEDSGAVGVGASAAGRSRQGQHHGSAQAQLPAQVPQSQPVVAAVELQHLKEQLEQVHQYLGAAADNYWPVLPPGARGFGAAGATSAPVLLPLPEAPPMTALSESPLCRCNITLQPLDLGVLRDVSGTGARATALALYSKVRHLRSALCKQPAASPVGGGIGDVQAGPASGRGVLPDGCAWEAAGTAAAAAGDVAAAAPGVSTEWANQDRSAGPAGRSVTTTSNLGGGAVASSSSGISRFLFEPPAVVSVPTATGEEHLGPRFHLDSGAPGLDASGLGISREDAGATHAAAEALSTDAKPFAGHVGAAMAQQVISSPGRASSHGSPSALGTSLHCSYAWVPLGNRHQDRAATPSSSTSCAPRPGGSNVPHVWLSIAWTDCRGELLEGKVAVLACPSEPAGLAHSGCGLASLSAVGVVQAPSLDGVAWEVCSRVLSESSALFAQLQGESGRPTGDSVTAAGASSKGREGGLAAGSAAGFDRLVVTKVGPMALGEAAAWKVLAQRWPPASSSNGSAKPEPGLRPPGSAAVDGPSAVPLPRLLVASLCDVHSVDVDLNLELPQSGSFLVSASGAGSQTSGPDGPKHDSGVPVESPGSDVQILLFPSPGSLASGGPAPSPAQSGDRRLWVMGVSLVHDTQPAQPVTLVQLKRRWIKPQAHPEQQRQPPLESAADLRKESSVKPGSSALPPLPKPPPLPRGLTSVDSGPAAGHHLASAATGSMASTPHPMQTQPSVKSEGVALSPVGSEVPQAQVKRQRVWGRRSMTDIVESAAAEMEGAGASPQAAAQQQPLPGSGASRDLQDSRGKGMKRVWSFGGRSPPAEDPGGMAGSGDPALRFASNRPAQHARAVLSSPVAVPVAGTGQMGVAQELHALAILNLALSNMGRQRQVGPYGSGSGCAVFSTPCLPWEVQLALQSGDMVDCRAVMPLHCSVAATLLHMCLVCDEVVDGRLRL